MRTAYVRAFGVAFQETVTTSWSRLPASVPSPGERGGQTAVWDAEHSKIVEDVLKRLEAEPGFMHFRDEVIAEFSAAEPRSGGER